jgi:hypothetical protein
VELGAHDFTVVDSHVGRLLHLELVDVECVLAVLEDMGAMVSVDQVFGLHLNADLFAKLSRRGRSTILTRPDVPPGQGELPPVGVFHE